MVTNDLYAWLPSIFKNGVKLIEDLTENIDMQAQTFSRLKLDLHTIYEVKKGAGGKITILYDAFNPLGHPARKYSGLQDDLLTAQKI